MSLFDLTGKSAIITGSSRGIGKAIAEQMAAAVQAYFDLFNACDADGIADLYADDATVTDPVGTPPKNSKADILAFYQGAVKGGSTLVQHGPTRIVANFAAFAFTVHVGGYNPEDVSVDVDLPSGSMTIDVIDTFEFNEDGKVTAMRAFWGPTNITKT